MSEKNIWKELRQHFDVYDIEWRMQSAGVKNGKPWGKCLAYVTNRAIQERLDKTVGPGNWKNEYTSGPNGGVLCGISIRYNQEWITKWDGADNTAIESVKGGLSDAMKRCAVQWGIGRYLYSLDENWAVFSENGTKSQKIDMKYYRWSPPSLPDWALPKPKEEA